MEFGELLKKLRTKHKISQRDLADKVGVDFTYISKVETGALAPPSEATIIKMARALDYNKYDLILSARKIPTDFEIVILSNTLIREMLKDRVKDFPEEH